MISVPLMGGTGEAWSPREVTTERMVLRPLSAADRGAFIDLHRVSREHLSAWMPAPEDTGLNAGLEAYFERTLERNEAALRAGGSVRLAGFARDGRMAGLFSLNNIVRGVGQMGDAGWLVSAAFAGQGYATEGVRALIALAFEAWPVGLGLHRVQAGIIPRNERSIRVAEKCGMRREGLALRYVRIAGVWEDHYLYARTAEEGPCPGAPR